MSSLPEEIIEENILTRLPVKSTSRFRCVSKTWRLLFQNPNFIKKHLNHAIVMNKFNILVTNLVNNPTAKSSLFSIHNDVLSSPFIGHVPNIHYPFMSRQHVPRILGSSNGLVCIEPVVYEDICIWNPATRGYRRVPEPSAHYHFDYCLGGFGFDCKNGDYKVLRIAGDFGSDVSEARIYSLASNSWKELGSIPYYFAERVEKGLLLNGVLHWIAIHRCAGLKSVVTVCFDISSETFHDVPLPKNYPATDPYMADLGIWEGKPCLLHTIHLEDPDNCTHENDHVDVWTMMDNKWSKHLKITAQTTDMYYVKPIQTLQNGEILFEGGSRVGSGLLSYDHKLERARDLKIHGFPDHFEVETYIETLVGLSSGTYVGQ